MKSKTLITALSVAALALAGCAGTDTQSAGKQLLPIFPDGQDAGLPPMDDDYHPADLDDDGFDPMDGMGIMEPGEYEIYSMEGAHIVFDLPSDPSSDELTEIEQYRETVKADPATYIIADVDNREGTDSASMRSVSVFDEDGKEYEFTDADTVISDWSAIWSFDGETYDDEYYMPDGTELTEDEYYQLWDYEDEILDSLTSSVSQAGRETVILIYEGDDLPNEFTRVAAAVSGFDEDAFPTDW